MNPIRIEDIIQLMIPNKNEVIPGASSIDSLNVKARNKPANVAIGAIIALNTECWLFFQERNPMAAPMRIKKTQIISASRGQIGESPTIDIKVPKKKPTKHILATLTQN